MTADDLRERLAQAMRDDNPPEAWAANPQLVPMDHFAGVAVAVFAEHLSSDATVERVARAQYRASASDAWDDEPEFEREFFRRQARAGLAALAAELAGEVGSDG